MSATIQPRSLTGSYAIDPADRRVAFEGKTTVNPEDRGVNWRAALEAGGVLVADNVLELEVSAIRTPDADLGRFGIGSGAGPQRRGVGLYHLAWQLDTIDELAAARDVPLTAGAYTGESGHGAPKTLYSADPDGNEFESMWMLPRDAWGAYEKAAPVDHLDLAEEVRRWSGVRTAGSIVATGDEGRS